MHRNLVKNTFTEEARRLFLSLGEFVIHTRFPHWGIGEVIEESNSTIPGGLSLVRIKFEAFGSEDESKTFNNNIDSEHCCYHAGVRKYEE